MKSPTLYDPIAQAQLPGSTHNPKARFICWRAIWIYTEKQAYATGEEITFLAISEEPDPHEFHWHFGDQTAVSTPSGTFIKKYLHPDRYNITVSSNHGSVESDIYNVVIQRAVHLNRLLYTRSVLLNTSVPFSCRINAGTDVTYLWDFGDGTRRVGQDIEHHVFNSTGEFIVEVTVSNLVSSASLRGYVFVVTEPCQPPPVKNMGPSKIQVQIVGTIVYSTYSVLIEVMPSRLVSIINGGTNVFINRHNSNTNITLDGRRSYDPDFSDNIMSIVHVSCLECRENAINWNEWFSIKATCESCPINVTYFWKLYLVNASSKSTQDVPFCGSLDISSLSKLEADTLSIQQLATSVSPSILNPKSFSGNEFKVTHGSVVSLHKWGRSVEHQNPSLMDLLSETESASVEIGSGVVNEMDFALFHLPVTTKDKNPSKKESGAEYPDEHGYLDYEDFYSGVEEADSGVSVGRPTGPHNSDNAVSHSSEYDGDNLVGPGNVGHVVSEKTLLDLYKELIQPAFFESFTSTGISSSLVTFKPMMLKPKSLYMLEVSANSKQVLQGKTQLFFSTHPAPEGMVCHVQPSSGYEVHTYFGIFCTSGKEDLLYEYSFSVGNSRKKILYKGRDYQHYFYLPSGDPYDDYKVAIYITVRNRFGASTKPCLVNVKVWPSFNTNLMSLSNPDQELYVYGLSNLTNLIMMKNTQDIINYIFLLTATFKCLSLDTEAHVKQQTQTRAALISAVCQLDPTNQELLFDILYTLSDLLKDSNQVTFDSALLVTKYIHKFKSSLVDSQVLKSLMSILSYILEAQIPSSRLTLDVLHTTTDSVLMYLLSSREPQFSVNSTIINLQAWQNSDFLITRTNVDLVTFYIPHMPINKHTSRDYDEKSCFITVITSYRQNPYHWAKTPLQANGHVGDMKLFNCSTKREIQMRHMSTPLIIEFQKQEATNNASKTNTIFTQYAGIMYLMILNADYDKSASNKYVADEVDYTLSVESTQCLVWDGVKEWRSDGCSVLQSFTSTKVNCSVRANPMVCIVIVVLVAFYAVLLVFCNHADVHVEKNLGTFILPDNNPSDQFFYAVTINTGLRSRAKMTAKVHVVLYGEKGVSQTRELINPDHKYFTCNSRTTFILSSAQSLGNIWQGSPMWIISLHTTLSSTSASFKPTTCMSSLTTSINLLFGPPLFPFAVGFILSVLLPMYPISKPSQSGLSHFVPKTSYIRCPSNKLIFNLAHPRHLPMETSISDS
ncbi:polycystic kidney disease protein 1-like 1 [Silurus asotus]|uniref:Polycystic kidney disease protein 1-like 1 n=1 Tax=Silurus asotus TaxID=30991 RepID=A0AAD5FIP5_SILAS|nr:polycystic kidney disease protein 1-like 1 [Silurus asotus]